MRMDHGTGKGGGDCESGERERHDDEGGAGQRTDPEDTIRTALLRKKREQRADENLGEDDIANLKTSLAHITDVWRQKTSGKRKPGKEGAEERRAPWRKELAEALESAYTHLFIVVLLLVDLLATAIDILKTIHNKSHDLDACVAMVESCTSCIGHFERSKEWEWTYWLSIAILIVLLVNIAGLFVAFGLSFFRHPGYVLDLVVVVTALLLEILLDADTAGLLIILTLWRIVRVAHGIFEVTDEAWEKDMKNLEGQIHAVQTAHDQDQELLRQKDSRIHELELQLYG